MIIFHETGQLRPGARGAALLNIVPADVSALGLVAAIMFWLGFERTTLPVPCHFVMDWSAGKRRSHCAQNRRPSAAQVVVTRHRPTRCDFVRR